MSGPGPPLTGFQGSSAKCCLPSLSPRHSLRTRSHGHRIRLRVWAHPVSPLLRVLRLPERESSLSPTLLTVTRLSALYSTELDVEKLCSYIEKQVKGFKLERTVYQFSFGQSCAFFSTLSLSSRNGPAHLALAYPPKKTHRNPTYLLHGNNKKQYVVRTRPPGPLISKTAHAIDREYRILDALGKDGSVPVPKVYHLCLDDQVIGRPWYLMEYLKGRKYEDSRMPEVKTKEERTQLCVLLLVHICGDRRRFTLC